MKNVGRLGKVLRTRLLFALNPEDKSTEVLPVKVDVSVQKEIEDVRITLYTVQEKDTISSVAAKFNVSTVDIIFANQLYTSQTLYPGQLLYVYEDLTAPVTNTTENTANAPSTPHISSPPNPVTTTEIEQVITLFPSSDSALLETASSYRLLLSNLRVIYDTNLSKCAAPSVLSPSMQPQTILQLAMKFNSNELLDEMKEHVIYVSSRENQRASGTLTATPRFMIFEPDWENPLIEQGMFNYRIQMSISDIIDIHMIHERTPPPLYEMELLFEDLEEEGEDEETKESYLQISVQSGVDPRVIRFVVPSERLTPLYQKIMAWTGRPIHAPRISALPPAFIPTASIPSSKTSPILRATTANPLEPMLFSAAPASRLRAMYQPDLDIVKERGSYVTKNGKVRGVITLTSGIAIFEPDLDDPNVVQHGLIANQINFFLADVYDCVFQAPTPPTSPRQQPPHTVPNSPSLNLSDSPSSLSSSWSNLPAMVETVTVSVPRILITLRDGSAEKTVTFEAESEKAIILVAKIKLHMTGRPKRPSTPSMSISSSPTPLSQSPTPSSQSPTPSSQSPTPSSQSPPMSPTPFSLASSPASSFIMSLKNSNILSKLTQFSRSSSDLTSQFSREDLLNNSITPQQRMIREIEEYEVKFSAPSILITSERAKFLRRYLNSSLAFHDWTLLYSTNVHGISLSTMYAKTREKGGVFIVIQDADRNVFGGFASESLHISPRYYGTGESFLFKLAPNLSVYPWPNSNPFFVLTTEHFISMGGGETGKYGFWLDEDFQKGSTGYCETFHNPPLADKETFECLVMEVWGFVS